MQEKTFPKNQLLTEKAWIIGSAVLVRATRDAIEDTVGSVPRQYDAHSCTKDMEASPSITRWCVLMVRMAPDEKRARVTVIGGALSDVMSADRRRSAR